MVYDSTTSHTKWLSGVVGLFSTLQTLAGWPSGLDALLCLYESEGPRFDPRQQPLVQLS